MINFTDDELTVIEYALSCTIKLMSTNKNAVALAMEQKDISQEIGQSSLSKYEAQLKDLRRLADKVNQYSPLNTLSG